MGDAVGGDTDGVLLRALPKLTVGALLVGLALVASVDRTAALVGAQAGGAAALRKASRRTVGIPRHPPPVTEGSTAPHARPPLDGASLAGQPGSGEHDTGLFSGSTSWLAALRLAAPVGAAIAALQLASPSRRQVLPALAALPLVLWPFKALARELPEIQKYSDFTRLPSGVQYKEVLPGAGSKVASKGDRIVYKWEGYTVGYYGRPFQKSNGPVGGAFTDDEATYSRFVLGAGEVVGAMEQAVEGMREGALRQILIPPGPLSYPEDDPTHARVGPAPSNFSGFRALNFVLFNQGGTMDKTLLINVKVVRIDKPGENGFAP